MQADLRPYVDIAVEELGIDAKPEFETWFVRWWGTFGRKLGGALGDDARTKVMQGKYPWQDAHLRVLHRVLTLHEYGLTPEETWKHPDEDRPVGHFLSSAQSAAIRSRS